MKEKIKKYWWIGLLLMVWIIVVFFLKKPDEKKDEGQSTNQKTTPVIEVTTIEPTIFTGGTGPSKKESEELKEEDKQALLDYPLWSYLPYEGDGWTVDHYIAPLKLRIYTRENIDRDKAMIEINKWMNSKGIKTGSHQVEWKLKEKK